MHGAGERNALTRAFAALGGGTDDAAARRIAGLDGATLDTAAAQYLAELKGLAPDKTRIVDKMPGNYSYLGLVGLMLPARRSSTACATRATSASRSSPSASTAITLTPTTSPISALRFPSTRG